MLLHPGRGEANLRSLDVWCFRGARLLSGSPDVAFEIGDEPPLLRDEFGDRVPAVTLIDRLVAAGELGKKSEMGFYNYENGRRTGVNGEIESSNPAEGPLTAIQIVDRLIDAMVNEAALALEERVVSRPEDVDLAMVLGTGFPPFRGGLLRYADSVGVGAIVERLARRQQEGAPAGPSGRLQQMALSGATFYKD